MNVHDYVQYDGIGLAQLIAKGEVTAAEVAAAANAAIASTEPQVNAIVEQWEGEIAPTARKDSPLYGVPFLIKDLAITMAGKKNELGSRLAEGLVMPADSTLMARFKAAGLVTLGRTTTPEFAISTTTEARVTGPTHNPWNPDYNAGGSTGGSAAAVAAGMVPLAHATDGGGSIRVPASTNNIFGLKPTRGRVSNGPLQDEVWSGLIAQLGLSRSVRDSAAMLDAISIPAVGEPYYTALPERSFLSYVDQEPPSLKIGLMMDPANGGKTVAVVKDAINKTAKLLESLGHRVELVVHESGLDWETFVATNALFWNLNTAAWVESVAAMSGRPINGEYLEPVTLASWRHGKSLTGMDVLSALSARNTVARGLGAYFERYDILMTPTLPDVPLKIGMYNAVEHEVDGLGWIAHVFNQAPFAALANLAGAPSMSVPSGFDPATNLPIGAMYTAKFGNDPLLFSLAGQLERAAPWGNKVPVIYPA